MYVYIILSYTVDILQYSAQNNVQQIGHFPDIWIFVCTKLHLTGQIISLVIKIIQQNKNSNLTARLIISQEQS